MEDLGRAAGEDDPERAGERELRTKKEGEEDGEVQESDERERESEKLILTLLWAGRLRKIREIE